MSDKKTLRVSDKTTVRWTDKNAGNRYLCMILADGDPINPREDDDGLLTHMYCWHRRYKLGDEHGHESPRAMLESLVTANVTEDRLDAYLKEHDAGDTDDLKDVQLRELLAEQIVFLPLWLYDHSGITMSCGDREYPYNDQWDSGLVGWIFAVRKEFVEMGVLPADASNAAWRATALKAMKADVAVYDTYLRGDAYGFKLYEVVTNKGGSMEYDEIDSCWNYFGDDIIENGMAYDIGLGLVDAIETDEFTLGAAHEHTVTVYDFD